MNPGDSAWMAAEANYLNPPEHDLCPECEALMEDDSCSECDFTAYVRDEYDLFEDSQWNDTHDNSKRYGEAT